MAFIGNQPAESFTSFATQEFSTSATTSYTLDHAVTNENEIALFVNNVRQQPGSGKAYTATGTALTLSAATASTDTMYCVFLGRALQTVNPAGGSVGSSQISADIITGLTALASAPDDTDEFLVSDAGTLKRIDYSLIKADPAMELLATTTVSSATGSVSFDGNFSSTYKNYKIIYNNAMPVSDSVEFRLRVRQSNADKTDSSSYRTILIGARGEFTGDGTGNNSSEMYVAGQGDHGMLTHHDGDIENTDVYGGVSGEINIMDPLQTSYNKIIFVRSQHTADNDNNGNFSYFTDGVVRYVNNANALSGVSFFFSSGNIDGGVFKLYGIK